MKIRVVESIHHSIETKLKNGNSGIWKDMSERNQR
jgi:hypothetical protein